MTWKPHLPSSDTLAFDLFEIDAPPARRKERAGSGRLLASTTENASPVVPAGSLTLLAVAAEDSLVEMCFQASPAAGLAAAPAGAEHRPDHPVLQAARRQLDEYFAGERREFELPLAPRGTEFERHVWQALCTIPFGETRSYAEIAAAIGRPAACRAVGRANGSNPLPIVVPCHRVIGSDGSLTGFGGGLELKRFLLALEGCRAAAGATPPQLGLPL
jgi:methylated-DNA-[protein]-cysteine S-methyltransferase